MKVLEAILIHIKQSKDFTHMHLYLRYFIKINILM